MTMSIDADRPGATSPGPAADAVAIEERPEHLGPVVADPRQQAERHAAPAPLPGHVEHPATRQHEVPAEVDVEAQRAEQQLRPRFGLAAGDHRSASGWARPSPSARNRS